MKASKLGKQIVFQIIDRFRVLCAAGLWKRFYFADRPLAAADTDAHQTATRGQRKKRPGRQRAVLFRLSPVWFHAVFSVVSGL